MDFVKRNIFWLGMGMSVVALVILYLILVTPIRTDLNKSTKELEDGVARLRRLLGEDIATPTKIKKAKETAEVLKKQYTNVEEYFADRGKETAEFWPEVILEGRVEPALFIVVYREKTLALEEDLEQHMELGDGAFQWKSFPSMLPKVEECTPAMTEFRMLEHVAGLIRDSKAVTKLGRVKLGANIERPFLTVRDLNFATRDLEIAALVSYERLLFLIAELERSDRNIFVDSVSVTQSGIEIGEGSMDPPVSVTLKCSMLYGLKKGGG